MGATRCPFSPVLGSMYEEKSHRTVAQTDLDEPNVRALLTETLTAEVKTVLANETSLVSTEAAAEREIVSIATIPHIISGTRASLPWTKNLPLAAALAKLAGSREPNSVVCHSFL